MDRIEGTKLDQSYEIFQKVFNSPRKVFSPPPVDIKKYGSLTQRRILRPEIAQPKTDIESTKECKDSMKNYLFHF